MATDEYGRLCMCIGCVERRREEEEEDMTRYEKRTEKQYLEDVERIAKRNGLKGSIEYIIGDEYGFSWWGCDVCGCPLGGDKHEVSALVDDEENPGKLKCIDIGLACTDCTIYIANGDLSGHDFAEEEEQP